MALIRLTINLELSPLFLSLKTAFSATIIAFFLGIIVAELMFIYQGKFKGIIDAILTLPIVLPPIAMGFILLLLLGKNSPIGSFLSKLDISIIFSWEATVIAATVIAFPLMYKTVLSAFNQVNPNYINVARTLGASETRIFIEVLLPLAWQGIVTGTILAFARALGEFGATIILAGNIPGKTQTMPIAIFFAAEGGRMDEAFFWVLIIVIISLAVILLINYSSNSSNFSQSKIVIYGSYLINRWLLIFSRLIIKIPLLKEREKKIKNIKIINSKTEILINNNQGLFVDIKKKFSNFDFEVKFNTNDKPLGIIGSSGSGKSMTLKFIAGLETPHEGKIVLNGRVLFDSENKINLPSKDRKIGFLLQNYALFPHLKVAHNIGFGLQNMSKEKRREIVFKYIELMHLQGLEKRYPHELSGGQQQRVALARALAINPDAILLDEPLSALDNYLRNQIEQLLIEVFETYQRSTLFVTHKLEEAYRICDNILVISQGKIIAFGHKKDIFENPPNYIVAQITECKNFSVVEKIDDQTIFALNWNCQLKVVKPISQNLKYVGIRANHLILFTEKQNFDNIFPCVLVKKSETQHRVTLYVKLFHQEKNNSYLQIEIFRNQWEKLKLYSSSWYIYLDPVKLILMEN